MLWVYSGYPTVAVSVLPPYFRGCTMSTTTLERAKTLAKQVTPTIEGHKPALKLVVPKATYTICPEIGDGSCGHVFTWLEPLLLGALSTEYILTTRQLTDAVDTLPLDAQHPRWSQVWGDGVAKRYPQESNRAVRVWCVREVLAHAARQTPPKCVVHHKVGGHRYNGYSLPK